jgi:hypothetical protein
VSAIDAAAGVLNPAATCLSQGAFLEDGENSGQVPSQLVCLPYSIVLKSHLFTLLSLSRINSDSD